MNIGTGGTDALDWTVALDSVQGDAELLKAVARAFLSERIEQQDGLRDAIADGDAANLRRIAHLIKGVMMTFGANEAASYAEQLESLGRSEELDGARELFEPLRQSLEAVAGSLASFCDNPRQVVSRNA